MRSQRKAVSHSCLPGLYPHSVLTRPVTEHFYLWHTTCLESPDPADCCCALLCCSSPGEEGESPQFCCLLDSSSKSSGPTVLPITVYGDSVLRAHPSALSLQPASPLLYLGALLHSGTPRLPEGPDTTLSQQGFHPLLNHWSHVPHQSRLLKVPILYFSVLSLACSWLMKAPSPCGLSSHISPQIHFSAHPAFQKVVAFLFIELLLFFSSISC